MPSSQVTGDDGPARLFSCLGAALSQQQTIYRLSLYLR